MRSSYIQNNFGAILTEYVLTWRPANFVELGVLDGYSTLAIAKGIDQLAKMHGGTWGKLKAYDLFEDYQFKHGSQEAVRQLLKDNGVDKHVEVIKGNAFEVHKDFPDLTFKENGDPDHRGVEFLHVDISNTGTILKEIMELWHPKIGWRGLIFIEGGSEERDNIEWMKKFGGTSIKEELTNNPIIQKYYIQGTYFAYPSMTVLLRKWWNVDKHN